MSMKRAQSRTFLPAEVTGRKRTTLRSRHKCGAYRAEYKER